MEISMGKDIEWQQRIDAAGESEECDPWTRLLIKANRLEIELAASEVSRRTIECQRDALLAVCEKFIMIEREASDAPRDSETGEMLYDLAEALMNLYDEAVAAVGLSKPRTSIVNKNGQE